MADLIVGAVLLAILGAVFIYIRKEKKNGVKCIGCPDGAKCGRNNGTSSCSCECHSK